MRFSPRAIALPLAAAALAWLLSGCSQTVSLDPAADSNNPRCAAVTVRLPDNIDGNQKVETNAQATAAWGTPSKVLLRCGLPEVKASTLSCVTAGGVDWLVDPTNAPNYRFVTFGRNPAVEVMVDSKNASGVQALEGVAPAIRAGIPSDRACEIKKG